MPQIYVLDFLTAKRIILKDAFLFQLLVSLLFCNSE